jgi:hypothetical protein
MESFWVYDREHQVGQDEQHRNCEQSQLELLNSPHERRPGYGRGAIVVGWK